MDTYENRMKFVAKEVLCRVYFKKYYLCHVEVNFFGNSYTSNLRPYADLKNHKFNYLYLQFLRKYGLLFFQDEKSRINIARNVFVTTNDFFR